MALDAAAIGRMRGVDRLLPPRSAHRSPPSGRTEPRPPRTRSGLSSAIRLGDRAPAGEVLPGGVVGPHLLLLGAVRDVLDRLRERWVGQHLAVDHDPVGLWPPWDQGSHAAALLSSGARPVGGLCDDDRVVPVAVDRDLIIAGAGNEALAEGLVLAERPV